MGKSSIEIQWKSAPCYTHRGSFAESDMVKWAVDDQAYYCWCDGRLQYLYTLMLENTTFFTTRTKIIK